ncbi:unnamed protein product [Caretta caretta]
MGSSQRDQIGEFVSLQQASWGGVSLSQSPCSLLQARGEPLQPLLRCGGGRGNGEASGVGQPGWRRREERNQCDAPHRLRHPDGAIDQLGQCH